MTETIFIAIEQDPVERFEFEVGESVAAIIERLRSRGNHHAELLVFLEDGDEPLGADAPIHGHGTPIMHAHRHRSIDVSVAYMHHVFHHRSAPSATIARVTRWATSEAGLALAEAGEQVLQLAGTRIQPPANAHLGSLHPAGHAVSFDLVRKQLVQG